MAACSRPDITVRLWTSLNESGVLLSLYYQGFRPGTIGKSIARSFAAE